MDVPTVSHKRQTLLTGTYLHEPIKAPSERSIKVSRLVGGIISLTPGEWPPRQSKHAEAQRECGLDVLFISLIHRPMGDTDISSIVPPPSQVDAPVTPILQCGIVSPADTVGIRPLVQIARTLCIVEPKCIAEHVRPLCIWRRGRCYRPARRCWRLICHTRGKLGERELSTQAQEEQPQGR